MSKTKAVFQVTADVRRVYFDLNFRNETKSCYLKELDTPGSDDWQNWSDTRLTRTMNETNAADGFKAELISRSLFYADTDQPVPREVITAFSSSAQNVIFLECQKLNGFSREGVDEAKKLL